MYFGYIWFHKSGGRGDRYKKTRVSIGLNALRLLLDIQASIGMIVEMFVHVMIASQGQCVEMAGNTNID